MMNENGRAADSVFLLTLCTPIECYTAVEVNFNSNFNGKPRQVEFPSKSLRKWPLAGMEQGDEIIKSFHFTGKSLSASFEVDPLKKLKIETFYMKAVSIYLLGGLENSQPSLSPFSVCVGVW
jgi:hypothetical protein